MKKIFLLLMLGVLGLPPAAAWPDRSELLRTLVRQTPSILRSFRPETGEFGTRPWICGDQNVIWPLAVLWSSESPDNPYFHDAELLAVIGKAGEKLVDAQDAQGMWSFRKKDDSSWGRIHMPWTYSRWIRTWMIVRDALPGVVRAKWEKGLKLGFEHIDRYMRSEVADHAAAVHAAALYIAGEAFGREDWQEHAAEYLQRIVDAQSPDGWWTEHSGPLVVCNIVYLDALGIYYHYSKNPFVRDALERGTKFHAALLWRDGTSVSAIDERNPYSRLPRPGSIGFSHTAVGRWYLLRTTRVSPLPADIAAGMLVEGGSGGETPPFPDGEGFGSLDGKFTVTPYLPYRWCFSAYTSKPSPSRWIMERQCHVEIAHDKFGVIAGGGNSRMQPYFSAFTFGDPDAIQPDFSTDKPDFFPKTDLRYLADDARIDGNTLHLVYGNARGSISLVPDRKSDALNVDFRVEGSFEKPVMAHLPLLRGADLMLADGTLLPPAGKPVSGRELGGRFVFAPGLAVVIPEDAVIRPAVAGFNPYRKFGRGAMPRMVVSIPLTAEKPSARIRFEPMEELPAETRLWNGDMTCVRTYAERCPAAAAAYRSGALVFSGRTTARSDGGLFARIAVPTSFVDGKMLCFDFAAADILPNDVLCIKGRTVTGKCVFSLVTALTVEDRQCSFAVKLPRGGGRFLPLVRQIDAASNEPVTSLEFHYGRSVRDTAIRFQLSDFVLKTTGK